MKEERGGVKNDHEGAEKALQSGKKEPMTPQGSSCTKKRPLNRPRRAPDKIFGNHLYFPDTRLQHRNSDLEDLSFSIEGRRPNLYPPDTRLQHRNPDLEDLSFSIEGWRPNLGTLEGAFSTRFSVGVNRRIE